MPDAHPQFVLTHWSAYQIAEGRGRHAFLAHSTSSISRQVASCERLWFGDVDADASRLADDLVVARDKHEAAGATFVDHVPVTGSVREPEAIVGQEPFPSVEYAIVAEHMVPE